MELVQLVQSLSHVRLFVTSWTAARQASLSIINSWSSLKLMSIESVTPSNHLILCRPFLLLPSIFPSIRVFSNESVLRIRWPKYWSFSFSISPSNEYSGLRSNMAASVRTQAWEELVFGVVLLSCGILTGRSFPRLASLRKRVPIGGQLQLPAVCSHPHLGAEF